MLKSIEEVYYIIDEIVKHEMKNLKKIGRKRKLTISEVITIMIEGHKRHYCTQKQIYELLIGELKHHFKRIPSYHQFTRAIRKAEPYFDLILAVFTEINAKKEQEFCIVDSTSLPVNGYNKHDVKWALNSAGKGKNMHGFYQGFKLHIIINQNRNIVSAVITKANVHDVQLLKDDNFIRLIKGILIGDKGYILSEKHTNLLRSKGIELIAKQRDNMDPHLNEYYKPLLKKRRRIEGIFGDLKTRFGAIFPFSRSREGFLANVKAALAAYIMKSITLENLYA
jgi:hypothetical protein